MFEGGALVKWLWVMTYVQEVVGSNPNALYWMDIFSYWFVAKIVFFVSKDRKRGQSWPIFFKKSLKCPFTSFNAFVNELY